jgi:hypothetical protein
MNFKDYFMINENKSSDTFCYMLYAQSPYNKYLTTIQKELQLDGELTKQNDFHITIRYVKSKKSPQPLIDYLTDIQLPKLACVTKNFEILGDDKCLVMEVQSNEIFDWFNQVNKFLLDCGFPDSDYKTYRPHISLTCGTSQEIPKFVSNKHKLKIQFTKHVITNSQHKVIFEKIINK